MFTHSPPDNYHRPCFIEYFLFVLRIKHGLIAILPGMLLLVIGHSTADTFEPDFAPILFFGLLTALVFQVAGVYDEKIFRNTLHFRKMFIAWTASFALLLLMHKTHNINSIFREGDFFIWYAVSLLGFGIARMGTLTLFDVFRNKGYSLQRAVILGGTESGARMAEYLQRNNDIRLGVVGFIDDRLQRLPGKISGLSLLGDTRELHQMIRKEEINQVFVALPWSAKNRIEQIVNDLKQMPVNVYLIPEHSAFYYAGDRTDGIGSLPMLNLSQIPLSGWSPFFKRMEDILLCLLFLIPLLPLMLIIAIAIKLDSPGPVLFRQKRYGYNNRLIEVYKFRSMHTALSDADCEKQTTRNDRRVTRVGRFIRKTSLDELPQLFNVLLGSMSLVGPRPHATATKAGGIPFEEAVLEYASRHRVKPGITGWAQINGYRGETDTVDKIEKRVKYDLEYIEYWSIWFDLYILFRTLPVVICTHAAY